MTAKCIHVIESEGRIERMDERIWESGFWPVFPAKAKRLVGGSIFFHKKGTAPSFFGGVILDYRIEEAGKFAGQVAFKFQYFDDHRGVCADKGGWRDGVKVVLPSG